LKSTSSGPSNELGELQYAYDGYLVIGPLTPGKSDELAAIAEQCPWLELYPKAIELRYVGRDTGRKIVKILVRLADLVGQADGEICCQVSGDGNQLWFEFYHIENSRLFRQRADLVRKSFEEVDRSAL
jgi:hypothetical protein